LAGDEVTNPFEVLEVQLQLQLLNITSFLAWLLLESISFAFLRFSLHRRHHIDHILQ
jgi:hypothetical protein